MADTFDIILFKTNNPVAQGIRSYTNSEFDHAAMGVKYSSEPWDVYYIEATSNNGVSFIRWSGIKHAIGTFYDKVVLRHLDWERTDESLELLEKFVDQVEGRDYDFALGSLSR